MNSSSVASSISHGTASISRRWGAFLRGASFPSPGVGPVPAAGAAPGLVHGLLERLITRLDSPQPRDYKHSAANAPMIPIVLHHGLFGFGDFKIGPLRVNYFRGIDEAIARRGHRLIVPRVHPTAGIALRAQQLKQRLLEEAHGEKVVIIAHSLGGLDARHMITHLEMADRVEALVTVSTPHRGSPYAEWGLKNLGDRIGVLKLFETLKIDSGAFHDLTTERCARFNEVTPDMPGVRYYSISASRPVTKVPPWAIHSWKIIHAAEGPNDGLVSVKSACWGEHLETWPADHWHTINKRFVLEFENKTGDIAPYYLRALDRVCGNSKSEF